MGTRGAAANDWIYSQTITLDTTASGANVTEDVSKYPLAVLLDRSGFNFNQARTNGADIRFFDSAATTTLSQRLGKPQWLSHPDVP
jgi:biopolymer transport protein ExbB